MKLTGKIVNITEREFSMNINGDTTPMIALTILIDAVVQKLNYSLGTYSDYKTKVVMDYVTVNFKKKGQMINTDDRYIHLFELKDSRDLIEFDFYVTANKGKGGDMYFPKLRMNNVELAPVDRQVEDTDYVDEREGLGRSDDGVDDLPF